MRVVHDDREGMMGYEQDQDDYNSAYTVRVPVIRRTEYNVKEVRERLDRAIADLLAAPAGDHCDHGTGWNAVCWACDQEGRVLCTGCAEGES